MPITVLSDLILPNTVISSGIRGKIIRKNDRVQTDNGFESINIVWSQGIRQYEFGTVPMTIDQWQVIESFHEITAGGAYGFLMFDPKDQVGTIANTGVKQVVTATETYLQIQRRYVDKASGRYRDRPITRPIAADFVLYQGGSPIGSGDAVVDSLTGRLKVSGDPATMSWSGRFYTPVHFLDDAIDWDLVSPGGYDQRFLAGPSVVLQEVKE